MVDRDGFRPNVGIILLDDNGQVFWAKRTRGNGWQFPQGGINNDESAEEAMFRELYEEVGLRPQHVDVLGCTPGWLKYELPKKFHKRDSDPLFVGQKQVYYLLKLIEHESVVDFNKTDSPEFESYRWVDFWYPAHNVIHFKRPVYKRALKHLEFLIDAV
ncbi:RNA pyrophosphohydrolase [Marinicella rhabdoformis]|uniref:RNA pyrophosphohydrolase n=1 Tax=Marinicella rhabdoformis TaxID=2580566 RepID=UPI0012AEB84D|nr:RNA pyrophosphohydrolase [Marinicella rhabdoformis]